MYLTHFPFGLGCSGAAIGGFVNGVLPNEETCAVYFQILGSDLQTLRDFYVQHKENIIALASHKRFNALV